VYKVGRRTGTIIWRMNGKKSDFTIGPGAQFFWQHDVRPRGDGVLTVFDNGALPAEEKQSRAVILAVDTTARHVTLTRAFVHPGRRMLADGQRAAAR
jgi:Arylsulfotransferase (ASST)